MFHVWIGATNTLPEDINANGKFPLNSGTAPAFVLPSLNPAAALYTQDFSALQPALRLTKLIATFPDFRSECPAIKGVVGPWVLR